MKNESAKFWQRKLLAFLHDPPTKPLDLAEGVNHENAAELFMRGAGFTNPEMIKGLLPRHIDWTAAAADRFPFPRWEAFQKTVGKTSKFQGNTETPFRHPLGGSDYTFETPLTAGLAADKFQTAQKGIGAALEQLPEFERDWANFFLHWRRWPIESAQHEPRSYFMPADTRLPDHNIWVHNSLASALAASLTEDGKLHPAFLIFQLGPVQDFIALARSTRDLWSGSYLLSWLIAHALKAVTDQIGPDAVIFPALRGQPIFDLLHREELYIKAVFSDGENKSAKLWDRVWPDSNEFKKKVLTPNLPNRFFALVPAAKAADLAQAAEEAVKKELQNIASACWDWFAEKGHKLDSDWRVRYDKQIAAFPQVTWQTFPWPQTETDIQKRVEEFKALNEEAGTQLEKLYKLATQDIISDDRDKRFFVNEDPTTAKLNNQAFAWPYFYAVADRLLAARRNTRNFNQADLHDPTLAGATKDAWSGKEESIGSEEWWNRLAQTANGDVERIFIRHYEEENSEEDRSKIKKPDKLSAINLVKKIWHKAYLEHPCQQWHLDVKKAVNFESVPAVAGTGKTYFAVLALDGDEMGKWISGVHAPALSEQLSSVAKAYFTNKKIELKDIKRPLSPSYHAQFSEALSNFALYMARTIINFYDGELIYAGGDDVLAMLPADKVFKCAEALSQAFRGEKKLEETLSQPEKPQLFQVRGTKGGFIRLTSAQNNLRTADPAWSLIVPGPESSVSIGIAIGHIKAPLQGMVRAAQKAEKRAKKGYGRRAFAVSLFKRSGEILEWGSNWNSQALELYYLFVQLSNQPEKPVISGRFAYALSDLLYPYIAGSETMRDGEKTMGDVENFPLEEIIRKEFEFVFSRQTRSLDPRDPESQKYTQLKKDFKKLAVGEGEGKNESYLAGLIEKYKARPDYTSMVIQHFLGLFHVGCFIARKGDF